MKQISPEMKRAVYETIKSQGNFYGKYAEGYYADDDLNIVNFLKLIWVTVYFSISFTKK